jgi:Protein of unknown function (DUF1826)
MQPEHRPSHRQTTLRPSPPCSTAQRLFGRSRSGPITLIPRAIDPIILGALDRVQPADFPDVRAEGQGEMLRHALEERIQAGALGPDWLARWLVDDVLFLVRMFQEISAARRVLLRLQTVEDDACSRFHTDNVRFRLVSTYRGPGTEWLSPRAASMAPGREHLPVAPTYQLARGDVAIMRGSRDATPECPGVLHRSPPIAGSGVTRLFLAIDDAADQEY